MKCCSKVSAPPLNARQIKGRNDFKGFLWQGIQFHTYADMHMHLLLHIQEPGKTEERGNTRGRGGWIPRLSASHRTNELIIILIIFYVYNISYLFVPWLLSDFFRIWKFLLQWEIYLMAQYQSYFRVTGTAHLRENLPKMIIFGQFRIVLMKNRIL